MLFSTSPALTAVRGPVSVLAQRLGQIGMHKGLQVDVHCQPCGVFMALELSRVAVGKELFTGVIDLEPHATMAKPCLSESHRACAEC